MKFRPVSSALMLLAMLALAACSGLTTAAQTPTVVVTPLAAKPTPLSATQCSSPAALTPSETEGPYYKPGAPEQSVLAKDLPGTHLTLTGYVLTSDCQPVPHALLDFWQADSNGQYDNTGYTLRGRQYTNADGSYKLETIVPGLYPGRTEHIHVKVQAPNGPVLTTQLFFPGVVNNDLDGIYNPALLIQVNSAAGASVMTGTFNFIVAK